VGAYREGDVNAAHPLAAPLSRWRNQAGVQHLRLANLPAPSLVTMVAEMLHVDRAAAAGLVEVIEVLTVERRWGAGRADAAVPRETVTG
jgi:hypothetical protein